MTEHPNAAFVRSQYDAWARGDATAMANAATEDAVFHVSGIHRLSGDYVGPDGVLRLLRLLEAADGDFCTTYDTVFANDEYVLVVTQCSGRRNGQILSWQVFDVLRVEKQKIAEFWTFPHPQETSNEFWS